MAGPQADASVLIIPDSSQFAAKLAAAVERATRRVEAKVLVTPNMSKFSARLKAAVRESTAGVTGSVRIVADASGLSASVDAAVGQAEAGEQVDVPVEADGTGFGSEVDRIVERAEAGQSVDVPVKTDSADVDKLIASFKKLRTETGGVKGILSSLKWPSIFAGVSLATGSVVALSGAVVALTASLGPLVNILPAVAAGGGALALGLGVAVSAFVGIGDALKGFTKEQKEAATATTDGGASARQAARATEQAANAVRQAQDGVASSQRSLTSAQERALDAVRRLTQARRDATEALDDESRSTERAELSEKRANLSLIQARERLRKLNRDASATASERADASLDVAEAELSVREAQDARADQQERFNELQEQGVEGSDQVVAAQREVADANQAVLDSQKGVEDATRALTEAMQDAADAAAGFGTTGAKSADDFAAAMAKLSPASRSLVDTLNSFRTPLLALRDVAAENLFPGLERGLRSLTPLFDTFTPIVAAVADTMGTLAERLGELISGPQFGRAFAVWGDTTVKIFENLGEAFLDILPALAEVLVAASPLAITLSQLAASAATLFASFIDNRKATGALSDFFDRAEDTLRTFGGIIKNLGGTFRSLFEAAMPVGNEYLELLKDSTGRLRDLARAGADSGGLAKFFESTKPLVLSLSGLIADLVKGIGKVGAELAPKLAPIVELIRTKLLPVFGDLFRSIDTRFLTALVTLAEQATILVGAFLPATPVLIAFTKALGVLLEGVNFLLTGLGPLSTALVGLISTISILGGVAATVTLAKLISGFSGAGAAAELLSKLLGKAGLTGAASGVAGAIGKIGPALLGIGAAVAVVITVKKAFDAWRPSIDRIADSLASLPASVSSFDEGVRKAANGLGRLLDIPGQQELTFDRLRESAQKLFTSIAKDSPQAAFDIVTAFEKAGRPTAGFRKILEDLGLSQQFLQQETDRASDALKRQEDVLAGSSNASLNYLDALDAMNESLTENGGSFEENTKEGRKNIRARDDLLRAAGDMVDALAEESAVTGLDNQKKDALLERLRLLKERGYPGAAEAVDKLTTRIGLIPEKSETQIEIDNQKAIDDLNETTARAEELKRILHPSLWEDFTDNLGRGIEGVKLGFDELVLRVSTWKADFNRGVEEVGAIFGRFFENLGRGWDEVVRQFREAPGLLADAITGQLGSLRSAAAELGRTIWSGITGAFSSGTEFAGDIGSAIVDSIIGLLNDRVIGGINAGIRRLAELLDSINIPGVKGAFNKAAERVRSVQIPDIPKLAAGGIVRGSAAGTVIDVAGRPVIAGDRGRDEAVIPLPNGLLAALERIAAGQVAPMIGTLNLETPNPVMSGREVMRSLRSAQAANR